MAQSSSGIRLRLNGQTIQSRTLQDGDRITIGSTLLEFRKG